eukprot:6472084-Amphidinium_carterae.1
MAEHFSLRLSSSFEHNLYEPAGARALAECWMSKMLWLYGVWSDAGKPMESFPSKPTLSWEPDATIFDGIPRSRECDSRLLKIVELFP